MDATRGLAGRRGSTDAIALQVLVPALDKTSRRAAGSPWLADPHRAQPAEPPAEEAQARRRRLLRVAVITVMAHRPQRRDPVELAFVAGPCALLAAVFVCIHRAERIAPGSAPGEMRRLEALVLPTVISHGVTCLKTQQEFSEPWPKLRDHAT
ncbi:hypothetical protein C2845_PM15G22250 [Panicum miliaceum]|uniref:Uncharacterized protein n=1 Tax=Panicum miliaceum TaxID=4540 RepID=A0A3L6Q681_PANMI|nr:hypothetical protein C2845_PM15G22250 [Panicum miliaceum]